MTYTYLYKRKNVEKLYDIREKMGIEGKHPATCMECGSCSIVNVFLYLLFFTILFEAVM
ncbi:MAG: hypothetical protein ACOCQN_01925 [Halanaerobiaceae bacterium]